ncbi:MAG: hypothetical protein QNK23_14805 [Crocinitomicaceae bacterium]|nr:hypothetical protein [Crocinitomicaceae bacterium]
MSQPLDMNQPLKEKTAVSLLIFGIVLILINFIASWMAYNDLWKYEVDQHYSISFGDPDRHLKSGRLYLIIGVIAVVISSVLFWIRIRKVGGRNEKAYAILALSFVLFGLFFKYFTGSTEMVFADFLSEHFYSYLAFSTAFIFGTCSIASYVNKAS